MKVIYTALIMLSIMGVASADSVSLLSSSNNIYNYQIIMNKTSTSGGIFNFLLTNSTGTPYLFASNENCTITNVITCYATFLPSGSGTYDTIAVYKNSVLLEALPTQSAVYIAPRPQTTLTIVGNTHLVEYVLIAVASVLIVGNITYYVYKR